MLVFSGTEGFITANPDLDRILTVAERPTRRDHARLLARVFRRYDLALSLVPGDRPTLYAFLAGRRRAGLLIDSRKHRWKRALLNAWVPFDGLNTHTVLMHLAILETIGIAPVREVVPAFSAADRAAAEASLSSLAGARYAVLHPFPKFRYKMWHERGWGEVGNRLAREGLRIVITGGPDAPEREYAARIAVRTAESRRARGRPVECCCLHRTRYSGDACRGSARCSDDCDIRTERSREMGAVARRLHAAAQSVAPSWRSAGEPRATHSGPGPLRALHE
jgi:heptosyltransferase-3